MTIIIVAISAGRGPDAEPAFIFFWGGEYEVSKRITGRSDDVSHNNGRRKLLKALGAGGGALVVSAMLPGRWIKPLARIGVLPAHAQMSNGGQYIPRSIQSSWPVPQGVISITITATGGKGG